VNWYALQLADFDAAGRVIGSSTYKQAPTLSEAMAEARYEMKLKGVAVSITGRRALYKEWNHYNQTISGELTE
jgi:hypothetical protein